jgi:hypothetical protein
VEVRPVAAPSGVTGLSAYDLHIAQFIEEDLGSGLWRTGVWFANVDL